MVNPARPTAAASGFLAGQGRSLRERLDPALRYGFRLRTATASRLGVPATDRSASPPAGQAALSAGIAQQISAAGQYGVQLFFLLAPSP